MRFHTHVGKGMLSILLAVAFGHVCQVVSRCHIVVDGIEDATKIVAPREGISVL